MIGQKASGLLHYRKVWRPQQNSKASNNFLAFKEQTFLLSKAFFREVFLYRKGWCRRKGCQGKIHFLDQISLYSVLLSSLSGKKRKAKDLDLSWWHLILLTLSGFETLVEWRRTREMEDDSPKINSKCRQINQKSQLLLQPRNHNNWSMMKISVCP